MDQRTRLGEMERLIPGLNGVTRGRVFPAQKFLQSERDGSLRIPSSIYLLTITGEYADEALATADPDVALRPDIDTIRVAAMALHPHHGVVGFGSRRT